MVEEILDHLVAEKIDCEEYHELYEASTNLELKNIFKRMSEDEHEHYKMLKDYLKKIMGE